MANKYLAALALASCVMSGGCFVSDTPLFDMKSAVYPFPDGSHYVQYQLGDKKQWEERKHGTLAVKNGYYIATNDGEVNDSLQFVLMKWGKNYIAAARGEHDKEGFLYGILQRKDGAFLEYGPQCSELGGARLKKMGLVTFKGNDDNSCVPTSTDALKEIMQMVLDSGVTKVDQKYTLEK